MDKNKIGNKLLKYFNVENHKELMEYISGNPEDMKVQEIKEILEMYGVDLDSEVSISE